LVIAAVAVVGIVLFTFAPVVYGFHKTVPSGVNVNFYESPSCRIFGFGGVYVYGQSIGGNGQQVSVSNYQFYWNCVIL